MDKSTVEAEISVHSKLMDDIPINFELVQEIDRQIKKIEKQLNDRLICITTKVVVKNFVPKINNSTILSTKVSDEVWNNLYLKQIIYNQTSLHEEISFEKHSKGYGFFYYFGEVNYDLGITDFDETDWYVKVTDDQREKYKLTGAPAEIKLKAFPHLKLLLTQINSHACKTDYSLIKDSIYE